MKEITIRIEGMHCNMCVTRMQKAFLAINGVAEAEVNLEDKCARIVFDAERVTEDDLRKTVADTGFQAA